jgi:taurine dioxygenase
MEPLARSLQLGALTLRPLTPTIGVEVEGIDLAKPIASQLVDDLMTALLEWKVLFFRNQKLTIEQHLSFARHFGELEVHPFGTNDTAHPEIVTLKHDREQAATNNKWHSDVTWREKPSLGSILHAIEVPPFGGDTLFADMYAAYEGLPDDIKSIIEGKSAVHDALMFRSRMLARGASAEEIKEAEKEFPPAEHPIVRTHPQTGQRALYVNSAFTQFIVGMEKEESDALLRVLYAQPAVPEYQCRFRWQAHSIAFWDNRCTQHYAVSDYWPATRTMERATIAGDRPW